MIGWEESSVGGMGGGGWGVQDECSSDHDKAEHEGVNMFCDFYEMRFSHRSFDMCGTIGNSILPCVRFRNGFFLQGLGMCDEEGADLGVITSPPLPQRKQNKKNMMKLYDIQSYLWITRG